MSQRRAFWLVLLAASIMGLIVRIEVGRKNFISFDEWQHVFMASSARWADLSFELRTNAHPPLFFLLLRYIVRLGNVGLYRSISIASGVGSIIVVGLIARKIIDSPIVQLLCAAAFALSVDAISISVEIRSYQLAVFLVLMAYWAWLSMPDGKIGHCVIFAICSSLAVLSHYSAAFFLGACVVVGIPRLRGMRSLAMVIPCGVFVAEYVVHASAQPMQGYLADFYWGVAPGDTMPEFVARNTRNFFNLFSPIEVSNTAVAVCVVLVLCAAALWVLSKRRRTTSGATILFAIVIVLELLAASLVRKYPFGGMLRHEYIAGPFLLLAFFVIVDTFPFARTAIPAFLLAAGIANAVVNVPKLIFYPGVVLLKPEFNAWKTAFPNARAVYVDHWAVIGYFIHTSDQPREFVQHIVDAADIDEYRTPDGTDIFYDKSRILLDFSAPSQYRSFAACLRASGAKELTIFFYSPGDASLDQTGRLESSIRQHAGEQGLNVTRVVVGKTSLSAGFVMADTGRTE